MQRAFSFGGWGTFDMSMDNNFLSFELGKREKHNGDSENELSHKRIGWSEKMQTHIRLHSLYKMYIGESEIEFCNLSWRSRGVLRSEF